MKIPAPSQGETSLKRYLQKIVQDEFSVKTRTDLEIDFLYHPLAQWIIRTSKSIPSPILIGINGPQGCGKSTLTRILVRLYQKLGIRAVSLSIDDFYLTRKDQVKLAESSPENSLLQQRGYPGTHDVDLGTATLKSLKNIQEGQEVRIPLYDKSRHNGQGDRVSETDWKKITGPLNLIFLEGWMLGFSPLPDSELHSALPGRSDFKVINSFLRKYQEWNHLLDVFIQLLPDQLSDILDWRVEAEERMKAQGKPGMSSEEIQSYIEKFIPAYQAYLPQLLKHPPSAKACVRVKIGQNRLPAF